MAKLALVVCAALFALVLFASESSAGSGECPIPGQVYSCSPKCIADSDCSYGKKCCPNQCNTKSCSETKTLGTSSKGGSSSGGSGIYCNNVKCNTHEKCGLDKATNRMKCIRS